MPRLKGTSRKQCRVCATTKPTLDFHKDRRFKGGFFPVCKDCEKSIKSGVANA